MSDQNLEISNRGTLSPGQIEALLRPVHPSRVEEANGMKHLPAYDVIAHLTRKFGFGGWDKELISTELLFETESGDRWTVAYRCSMRLTIRDLEGLVVKITEDAATGDAVNQKARADAHDLALKSAVSGALKRCAKDLGDQFGLSLYDKGSLEQVIPTVPGRSPDLAAKPVTPPATALADARAALQRQAQPLEDDPNELFNEVDQENFERALEKDRD